MTLEILAYSPSYFSLLHQEVLYHPAAMGGQPVPDHQQLAPQVPQQMLQELLT